MAPRQYLKFRNLLLLFLLALFATVFVCSSSSIIENQSQNQVFLWRKLMSETVKDQEEQGDLPKKKKSSGSSSSSKTSSLSSSSFGAKKNQTKLVKPGLGSSKNQSKLIKPVTGSSKNKTKLTKTTNSDHLGTEKTVISSVNLNKIKPKKMNSTSKPSNSTKSTSTQIKKPSDLTKSTSGSSKSTKSNEKNSKKSQPQITKSPPNWIYQEDDQDFISEIKDLPTKFHQSFIPDLHRISTRSKLYLSNANKQITNGFKPYFGHKYSPFLATTISCTSIILPLLFLSLLFNRIKPYFSLQKLLIFIQIYLSVYFLILCLSSIITGLEPLRFLYATSPYSYVWVQVLQTLGYVLYLVLLLMYLVLVFSTECGLGLKLFGVAQTFVGFSVGLHYYVTVFHRVVLRQPPKTNWKVHGVYTTCFSVICLLATAERRKKAYLEEGGEEGKKS